MDYVEFVEYSLIRKDTKYANTYTCGEFYSCCEPKPSRSADNVTYYIMYMYSHISSTSCFNTLVMEHIDYERSCGGDIVPLSYWYSSLPEILLQIDKKLKRKTHYDYKRSATI